MKLKTTAIYHKQKVFFQYVQVTEIVPLCHYFSLQQSLESSHPGCSNQNGSSYNSVQEMEHKLWNTRELNRKAKKIKCFISPHSNWDEQYMCSLKRKNKPISSQIKDKYQGTLTNGALSVQNEKYKPKILIHYTGVFRSSWHKSEPLNTQISSNYGSLLAPVSCAWGRKK